MALPDAHAVARADVEANGPIAVGLSKGYPTTKRSIGVYRDAETTPARTVRPGLSTGRLGKRIKAVRQVVREVAGLAPYEKRMVDLMKAGAAEKRIYKYAKKRLGTHRRALIKREQVKEIFSVMKRTEAAAAAAAKRKE